MNRDPLVQKELDNALQSLSDWEHKNDCLVKTFRFKDFQEAIAFIIRIAFHAENLDHHPVIFNVYDRVRIEITTHSVGNKVTQLDVLLAAAIDQVQNK